MPLLELERDAGTDELSTDPATIRELFRRLATTFCTNSGHTHGGHSEAPSGVQEPCRHTLSGKELFACLMDYTTVISSDESLLIVKLFVEQGLLAQCDGTSIPETSTSSSDWRLERTIFHLTDCGQLVCRWNEIQDGRQFCYCGIRIQSTQKFLERILGEPSLRLMFREFLRYSMCEENLSFYLDAEKFRAMYEGLDWSEDEETSAALVCAYGKSSYQSLTAYVLCNSSPDRNLRNLLMSSFPAWGQCWLFITG